jgi:hypothetical protein
MALQPTLFPPLDSTQQTFLLTNRYNLLEYLGSRLVQPIEGFAKYYQDLLRFCPGRIPLLTSPFPENAVALVGAEDEAAFPVALEIDSRVMGADTPEALFRDLRGGDMRARAPSGSIPLTHVQGIHFRSSTELDEHRLREHENVRHADHLYRVSPDLFQGSSVDLNAMEDWLQSLPSGKFGDLHRDRNAGAISLMANLCPPIEIAIETVRRSLGADFAARGRRPYAEWLVAVLTGVRSREPTFDETLFSAAYSLFAASDTSRTWRPAEALSKIRDAVVSPLPSDDRTRLDAHFERIGQIVRSELRFERLRPQGSPSEKALLLALLRPDPGRFSDWSSEETGADWDVTLATAALVGALKGRRRMSVELRGPELDDFLATREALLGNAESGTTLDIGPLSKVRLESIRTARGRRLRMLSGRIALGFWELQERDVADVTQDATGEAEPNTLDNATEAALIELCDEFGWEECTGAVIEANAPLKEYQEPGVWRYTGTGRVSFRRVLDHALLRARLESKETQPELRDRVEKLLDAGRQAIAGSQRYSN